MKKHLLVVLAIAPSLLFGATATFPDDVVYQGAFEAQGQSTLNDLQIDGAITTSTSKIVFDDDVCFTGEVEVVGNFTTGGMLLIEDPTGELFAQFSSPVFGFGIQAGQPASGWARYYGFHDGANALIAAFGAHGNQNTLEELFLGKSSADGDRWLTVLNPDYRGITRNALVAIGPVTRADFNAAADTGDQILLVQGNSTFDGELVLTAPQGDIGVGSFQ